MLPAGRGLTIQNREEKDRTRRVYTRMLLSRDEGEALALDGDWGEAGMSLGGNWEG